MLTRFFSLLLCAALTAALASCDTTPTTDTDTDMAADSSAVDAMPQGIMNAGALPSGEQFSTTSLDDTLASPRLQMEGNLAGSKIIVNYGSPGVKGRTIWGELVPFDRVWRTGANEATVVTFEKDVLVDGKPLKAGSYALFTVPGQENWTVIFNKTTEQWGAYDYSDKDDVLTVTVAPRPADKEAEHLYFGLEDNELTLHWSDLIVPVKLQAA
ncbi:MAG: DUF2911 domain-containing protein [Saprospiraceae bacterium]